MTSRRCGVLGHPIAHSLSPALHRAAYSSLGLEWDYTAHDVELGGLGAFLGGLGPEWAGLSITMPLKPEALAGADSASAHALQARAANTLVFTADGVAAHNTDVEGMVGALDEAGADTGSVMLLGTGATARSALVALAARGTGPVTVVGRRSSAVDALVSLGSDLEVEVRGMEWPAAPSTEWVVDLIVSTVPASVADAMVPPDIAGGLLFDVLYDPWPTPLAARWPGPVLNGLDLLAHQAVGQVRLMTGGSVEAADLRVAGARELQRRRGAGDH
jgi:shikimate dehydrogenase